MFDPFIRDADRRPYGSYAELKKALLKEASGAKMLDKLRALKPGVSRGAYTATRSRTRTDRQVEPQLPPDPHEQRLSRVELALSTMTRRGDCFQFLRTGRCSKGDA